MELDASGVFQLAMAGIGIPILVVLFRRRGTDQDPVPSGEPPVEPSGLAGPGVALLVWVAAQTAFMGMGWLVPESGILVRLSAVMGSHVLALGAAYGLVLAMRKGESRKTASHGPSARAGALFALAFLPVGLVTHLAALQVQEALTGVEPEPQKLVQEAASGDPVAFTVILLFGMVAAPLLEEMFFRGILYSGLRRHFSPLAAAVVAGLGFAMMHLEPTNLAVFPPLLLLALCLAYLRERTGGLVAPIVMHSVYNSVQLAGVFLFAGESL